MTQGSDLCPLLFLIFINDVADNITGFGRLFADDTCIGHTAHNEDKFTYFDKYRLKIFKCMVI